MIKLFITVDKPDDYESKYIQTYRTFATYDHQWISQKDKFVEYPDGFIGYETVTNDD